MMATNTIEPVALRLVQEKSLFESPDRDQMLVPRFSGIVYFGTAGSTKWHRIVVPDEVVGKIHGASGRPMRVMLSSVLSQQMGMGSYLGHTNSDGAHSGGFDLLCLEPQPPDDSGASTATVQSDWPFDPYTVFNLDNDPGITTLPVVQEFAVGVGDVQPSDAVVAMATRIVQAALDRTTEPEFSVDDDGALSIDLQLASGMRLLAELPIDGSLDVGVYDDRDANQRAREVEYLPSATAKELINLL